MTWVAEKKEPSPNYTENCPGVPEVVGPLILYDTILLFADTSLRFNFAPLHKA